VLLSVPSTFSRSTIKRQGLSHYLEHMLFMGSAKYPDENEYDDYLTKHGGSSNAFTELVRYILEDTGLRVLQLCYKP